MNVFDIISERQESPTMGLTIFDIDDTLFHTTAQIKVVKDGKVIRSLTNQEFNNYTLQPGEEFDFGEFRSAEKFAKESEPIKPMINTLKRILDRAANTKVIMLTARADFDNKEQFLKTFERYGIDMSRVHVHRAGNLPGDEPPAYKKAIWVRKYLNTGKYNRVNLIDDSMTNLKVFKSLKKEYPQVDFDAYFVKPTGSVAVVESWSKKYKKSINCSNPKGFSQRAHCAGRRARQSGKKTKSSSINEKIGDVTQYAEPGDTVYSIARQNNIDPIELMKFNGFTKDTKLQKGQEVKIPQKNKLATANKPTNTVAKTPSNTSATNQSAQPKPITGNPLEQLLRNFAINSGIMGKELAQFLAQCAHETMNYASLVEFGDTQDFLKKYDPRFNPTKAKTLGNTVPGDGERFKGRGFIQLTGRWNYTQAAQSLGLPLDKKPELLENPRIAAQASIWFWKNRVQPNVRNFTDTKTVTSYINPALYGLKRRQNLFQDYLQTMSIRKEDINEDTAEKNDILSAFEDFLPLAMKILKIKKIPRIKFADKVDSKHAQPTFGMYHHDTKNKIIELVIKERHPVDVLRTLAHELVHFRQDLEGKLSNKSWETGSDTENEAHEIAGIIMREFDKKYKKYLNLKAIDLEETISKKYKAEKEDYHPNDTPPGPETKPTMPTGTVKVDVSDVYDWYKLGQHISNLKGLGKHDFGKGPPSTIMSFGSEEEEHEYIKNLEKTGLTTTDIDPIDLKQPKGMKRQKVDPTYNVGENFADGRNPQDKGDSARHGIPKKASISTLKKIRSSDAASPRKKQLAHWQINMRQGRKK